MKRKLTDTDNSVVVITREEVGWGEVKESKGGIVMEGDMTWGDEHTIQYTVDVP